MTGPKDAKYAEFAQQCGAYYSRPKGPDGKFFGPLVGYAGKDDNGKQYVGDVYIDFAKIEEKAWALYENVAHPLATALRDLLKRGTAFCGAPEGGKALAYALAFTTKERFFYPDKVLLAPATANSRAQSKLEFLRHPVVEGERVILVEDVCNNFSTTADLIRLVERGGGIVVGIACFLNRSLEVDDMFTVRDAKYPVVALWREKIMQYKQDDPYVAESVANGNVVWQPKYEWERLMKLTS